MIHPVKKEYYVSKTFHQKWKKYFTIKTKDKLIYQNQSCLTSHSFFSHTMSLTELGTHRLDEASCPWALGSLISPLAHCWGYRDAATLGFTWIPGIRTQVLLLAQQVFYWLSHLPSHETIFKTEISSNWQVCLGEDNGKMEGDPRDGRNGLASPAFDKAPISEIKNSLTTQ